MVRTSAIFPTLRYENPAAAIDWLTRTLGFRKHFVAEEGGVVVHAQMGMGDQLLFLGPDRADDVYGMHSPRKFSGTSQCVCIAVEDVDALAGRVRAAGGEMIAEPHDTPYGAREFSCRDPEGHVWAIGNYWGEATPNKGQS